LSAQHKGGTGSATTVLKAADKLYYLQVALIVLGFGVLIAAFAIKFTDTSPKLVLPLALFAFICFSGSRFVGHRANKTYSNTGYFIGKLAQKTAKEPEKNIKFQQLHKDTIVGNSEFSIEYICPGLARTGRHDMTDFGLIYSEEKIKFYFTAEGVWNNQNELTGYTIKISKEFPENSKLRLKYKDNVVNILSQYLDSEYFRWHKNVSIEA